MSIDEVLAEVDRYGCPTRRGHRRRAAAAAGRLSAHEPAARDAARPCCSRPAAIAASRTCPRASIRIVDVKCPGSGEAAKMDWDEPRPAHRGRSGQVRHQGSHRLRVRARRRHARAARRPRGGRAVLAGARRAGRAASSRRVDSRRRAAGATAAAGPQVHLGAGHARRVTARACGGRPPERRARLLHGGGRRQARRLRALRAQHPLRPASRARARGGARAWPASLGVARHLELDLDLSRIGGSALTADIAVPKDRAARSPRTFPSPTFRRATRSFSRWRWAGPRCSAPTDIVIGVNALDYSGYPDCRPEFIHAFERLAQLATRAGVEGRTLDDPHAAHHAVEGGDHHARHLARPRLRA